MRHLHWASTGVISLVLTSSDPHCGHLRHSSDMSLVLCIGGAGGPAIAEIGVMPGGRSRQLVGREGEALARAELESRGYVILETGFRTDYGELDIIARHGEVLVFVEVRTRQVTDCGTAAESVTRQKQWRVSRAACAYLVANGGFDSPCRFDVVAIDFDQDGQPQLALYESAFDGSY